MDITGNRRDVAEVVGTLHDVIYAALWTTSHENILAFWVIILAD